MSQTRLEVENVVFVIGATNAGKTTFMSAVRAALPRVGLVEVGKLFRAKYPPEYFKGDCNPAHTKAEAIQLMLDGITGCAIAGQRTVLVDGQPRDMEQCNIVLNLVARSKIRFIHLYAPAAIREERARKRDAGNDAALQLSLARMVSDTPKLFEIVSTLHARRPEDLFSFDTTDPEYDPLKALGTKVLRNVYF